MTLAGYPRLESDPRVCGGRVVIKGTRLRVVDILEMLAGGMSEAMIVADYPQISPEDVRAALSFAAESQRHPLLVVAG